MATLANSVLFFQWVSDLSAGTLSTINILNSSGIPGNYHLTYGGWSPKVSKRKQNMLSGSVSYEPVEDEMTLDIKGATASEATHNLQILINALDQADRWYDNQWVAPVRIWYQPKGSTVALNYNTLVLGNRSSDDWAQLPVVYDEVGSTYWIRGVVIKFLRAGLWYQSDTANTAATSAVRSGALGTITLPGPNSDLPSPCDLTFGSFDTTAIPQPVPASVLIIADNTKSSAEPKVATIDPSSSTTGVKYTSVNDSAKNAINTTIMRYTPTDTAYNENTPYAFTSTGIAGNILAIYATIRNNSTTTTFKVKCYLAGSAVTVSTAISRTVTQETFIDASIQTPRVVFLGTVVRPTLALDGLGGSVYLVVSIQASAASGSVDFENIILTSIDDETVSILELPQLNITGELSAGTRSLGFFANQGNYTVVNPFRGHTPIKPVVILNTGSPIYVLLPVNGLMPIMVQSNVVKALWLCVAANGVDRWPYVDNANNPKTVTTTITARHSAYLLPE